MPSRNAIPKRSIIFCSPYFGNSWSWFGTELTDPEIEWYFVDDRQKFWWRKLCSRPNLSTPWAGLRVALLARKKGTRLLLTLDGRIAFWCSFFCHVLGVKIEHIVLSFNFPVLPPRWKRLVMSFEFRRIEQFFVHSTAERAIYHRSFSLPQERFEVKLWALDPPAVCPHHPIEAEEYISAIGGNARDYATLADACRLLPDIPFVLVVRPESLRGIDAPPNVRVHTNLPVGAAMNVLNYSRFTVIPLPYSEVPSGHVTIVAAMHLGKAIVTTDSSGIRDYVMHGYNGLLCQPKNPASLATAIRELWEDRRSADTLGQNGRSFAEKNLTNAVSRTSFASFLESRHLLRPIPVGDQGAMGEN